jgi:DNA-binding GntR family transcriptional regulator
MPLVQQAYENMRRRILDLEWTPGFTMLESQIAEELSMSRTPVREALIRLQEERLVEVRPRHGMRVLPVSSEDMRKIYEVLTSLESTAAALAAGQTASRDQLRELEAATSDMERAVDREDRMAWAQADERFHQLLVQLSGNEFLIETVNRFWDMAHRARLMTLQLREIPRQSTREHRELCNAIVDGNGELAAQIHRAHRERGVPEMTRYLQIIEPKKEQT